MASWALAMSRMLMVTSRCGLSRCYCPRCDKDHCYSHASGCHLNCQR